MVSTFFVVYFYNNACFFDQILEVRELIQQKISNINIKIKTQRIECSKGKRKISFFFIDIESCLIQIFFGPN